MVEVAADQALLRMVADTTAARLSAMVDEPALVMRCVAPGLVAAILGTGVSFTLGLEEAYRQYCLRLAANGSVALVFYVAPTLHGAASAFGLLAA